MHVSVQTNGMKTGNRAAMVDRAKSPFGAHGVRPPALPSDRGALEVSGANLMYEGARVKSWMLGRDLNPGGRGYGDTFPHGAFAIMNLRPQSSITPVLGSGNSVNNGDDDEYTIGGCCIGLPPCLPGYRGEECNCCTDTEDPADSCCCSPCEGMRDYIGDTRMRGVGCLEIPLVMMCNFAPFTFADDHCARLKARTDLAYIGEFCASRRGQAACFDLNCPGHPITGWYCCYEYCKSMGFGDSGDGGGGGSTPVPPPGGGGCASCGGGGGFRGNSNGQGAKNIRNTFRNSASNGVINVFTAGLRCLQAAINSDNCLSSACCNWHFIDPNCDVCSTRVWQAISKMTSKNFSIAKQGARQCTNPNTGQDRYVFAYCSGGIPRINICKDAFPIDTIYGKTYGSDQECLAAAIIYIEAYKCIKPGKYKSLDDIVVNCIAQLAGLAVELCLCAKENNLC